MTARPTLEGLGWNDRLAALAEIEDRPASEPGRVSRIDRGLVTVLTEAGAVRRSRRRVPSPPAIGCSSTTAAEEPEVVATLPRASAFVRGDPMEGKARDEQVIAANIDTVFVVHSLTNGPNLRRLERELVARLRERRDAGRRPHQGATSRRRWTTSEDAVRSVAPAVDVVVTSAVTGVGHRRSAAVHVG